MNFGTTGTTPTTYANATYSYDSMGRVATTGNGVDTLTYSYLPGTAMVSSATWTNANSTTNYEYDQYKRLTQIKLNNQNIINYALNDKNQRTAATLGNGDTWSYTYDGLGQLTGANKSDSTANTLKNLSYNFDLIGNRVTSAENGENKSYSTNIINQYTGISTTGATTENPTYDPDGNMLSYGGWNYSWNGENRLVVAENPTTNEKMEFAYDYMGRRLFKKVYNNNVLTKHIVFAYDDYKLIAEFDVLDNKNQTAKYLWQVVGLDVPLMRNEEYFVADGNKNILALKDASGNTTVSYNYDPFGKVSESTAHANPFKFSSEYHDPETGLVYYNYRYYSPALGRWLKPDPIEEMGGLNLYGMVNNNTIYSYDYNGMGVLLELSSFIANPQSYLLGKISKQNILAFAIVESAKFSIDFYKFLLAELNNSKMLMDIKLNDPETGQERSLTVADIYAIDACLYDTFPADPKVPGSKAASIETAGTVAIDKCLCLLKYTNKKGALTQKAVTGFFGKVGTSIGKAAWNRIIDNSLKKVKKSFVKEVVKKLPDSGYEFLKDQNKDIYTILINELVKITTSVYEKEVKF